MCLLIVARCVCCLFVWLFVCLCVVCCSLRVVRCLLFVGCLFVGGGLFDARCSLFVVG